MRRSTFASLVLMTAIVVGGACSDTTMTGPTPSLNELSLDLVPAAGTAGTDRYVPLLERVLHRAVTVVRESRGDDAATRIVTEYRRLRREVVAARETEDQELIREKVSQLESFSGRVALRVFDTPVARRVLRYATAELESLGSRLRSASGAGQDVSRLADGARRASRYIRAAQTAAANGRPLAVLLHAAHAADLLARLQAAL